jgi:hypothetical protein
MLHDNPQMGGDPTPRDWCPALDDLGVQLTDQQAGEMRRRRVLVQLKSGPFDLDLIFAPEGIEGF